MPLNEYDNIMGGEKPAAGNEYDKLISGEQQDAQTAMRSSLTQAAQTEPDRAANVVKLSRRSGLPTTIVERNYDELAKKLEVEGNDYDSMLRQTPKLAKWLADGENAAVAKDDLARLGVLEWMVTAPARAWRRGTSQVAFGKLSSASMFRDLSAAEHQRMKELREQMQAGGDLAAETWFGKALVGGAQQLPMLFGGLIAGADKGAPMALTFGGAAMIAGQAGPQIFAPEELISVPAAATMGYYIGSSTGSAMFGFEQEAGHAFEEFSKFKDELGRPLDRDVARAAAIAAGGINAGLEVFQLNTLMRTIPGADKLFGGATRTAIQEALRRPTIRAALRDLMVGYGKTLSTEVLTEITQRAVTILSGELGKVASGQDIEKRTSPDIMADLAHEAIEAAQAFTYLAAPGHVVRAGQDGIRIREAKKQEAFFTALGEGVTQSKTFERLPEKVQEFISEATKDGPIETIYVPVEAWIQYFQEKGLDPKEVAGEVLGDTAPYEAAASTGADIPIKMAAYATRLAPTEHNAFFARELRLAPDQMNAREAEELETQLAAEQKAANDAERQAGAQDEEAVIAVMTDVTTKLVAAGVEQSTAQAYAQTYGAAFRSIAQRAGLNPQALYERYGLQIGRDGIEQQQGDTVMAQVDITTPEFQRFFEGSKVVDETGAPLVVNHQTHFDFEEFDRMFPVAKWGRDPENINRVGLWFTDSTERLYGPKNLKVYLSIKNPLVYTDEPDSVAWRQLEQDVRQMGGATAYREELIKEGHDGVLLKHTDLDGITQTVWLAFEPEQIKSVDNRGTFDPESPNIFHQGDVIDGRTGEIEPAPPFYSEMYRQIERAKMDRAPADQWKKLIASLSSKGVKKEEIVMSGVMDWLDMRQRKAEVPHFQLVDKSGEIVAQGDTESKGKWDQARSFLATDKDGILTAQIMQAHADDSSVLAFIKVKNALIANNLDFDKAAADLRETYRGANEKGIEDMNSMFHRLKDMAGDLKIHQEEGPQPGQSIVPMKQEAFRVEKQEVLDFLAEHGVQVKEKIRGEPMLPEVVDTVKTEGGYSLVRLPEGGFQIRDAEGNQSTRYTSESRALTVFEQFTTGVMPDGYDIEQVEGGFEVRDEDGELVDARDLGGDWEAGDEPTIFDTRASAIEAARDHYISRGVDADDYSNDMLKEKAEELMQADIPEMARQYAQDSEGRPYKIALRPPTYEVVKVEGSGGVVDMFLGRETPTHWRVRTLEFDNLPDDDEIDENSNGTERSRHNMPDDADEFWEMFGEDAKRADAVDTEFKTEEEAHKWAEQNIVDARADPVWIPWNEDEGSNSIDEKYYGEHEDLNDAGQAINTAREADFESEVEYYTNDHEWNVDDFGDRYYNLAREALEEEDGRDRRRREVEGHLPRLYRPRNENDTRHTGSWQSEGGRDYREMPLYVPGIEPFNATDSTHFGPDTGGRTISWARFKVHDDNKGVPTLWIEELQSQRAQAGRDDGFKGEHQRGFTITLSGQRIVDGQEMFPTEEAAREWLTDYYTSRDRPMPENVEILPVDQPGSVPPAPFVKDTKAWTALTLKRVLRYAVDKGIKQIAWTTGSEQIARYKGYLREQVDAIEWSKGEGGIQIKAKQRNNVKVDRKMNPREVRVLLGPAMAQKIINDPAQSGELTGDDITLDDAGMYAYYGDEEGLNPKGDPAIVPFVAEKLVKSLGGKGIQDIDITVRENGIEYNSAKGFTIDEAMAGKVKGGLPMFQTGEGQQRGRIRFNRDRKFNIDFLKGADLSTFLHESGHFWLEVLGDVAQEMRITPADKLTPQQTQMRTDYDALLKWLGVQDRGQIGIEQHEKFARGIEAYLMEGKAPSAELRTVFARFRAWLMSIYRSIRKLNVDLTPEVRDVMDRMFASDAEIEAAQNEAQIAPLFVDAKAAGMTDAEFNAYKDRLLTASARAKDELQAKLMRTLQREREKWWKDEREKEMKLVAADVHKRREYVALSVLQADEMPDGSALPYDLQRVKIDRKAMPEDAWKALPRGTTAASGGIHPNTAAELLGYGSGEELVEALKAARPMRQVIEAETDARMREKHGDMMVDGTMIDAAKAAIHNEDRVKVIEAELRALSKLRRESARAVAAERGQASQEREAGVRQVSASVPPLSAVRQMAEGRVSASRVRDLTPGVYLTAARKNGQAAIRAAAAGDYETAVAYKQRELMNVELFRYATRAIEEVEKTVDYLQSFGEGGKRARIGKAGQDYLDQIDGFLERYDFARVPLKTLDRRKALATWIAEKERQGEPVDLPDDVVLERRLNWKDMTVEELSGVRDSVKHIEHLARLKNRLLTAKRNKDLAAVVTEIEESIRSHAKGEARKTKETRLPGEAGARFVNGWFASHRKIASLVREMDGFADGGALWEYVIRPMNEAADREASMNAAATKKLAKLFDAYKGADMRALYEKTKVDAIGESLTKMGRIAIALNWGNLDSRQKLMDGYGWNEQQVAAILDTLDERDWKFVQGVWDFIGGYWSEIESKERRVKGVSPERVQASPVTTRFGEFAGGYYPLRYDDRQSPKAQRDLVKETAAMMMKSGYGRTSTRRGHTKERIEGVREPIRLDLGVLFEHVTQVVHDLTHHEMLMDVNRLVNAKPIASAMIEHYGNEARLQFTDAIEDIASGDVGAQKTVERAVNWVRQGVSIAAMGWNLMTSLLQPMGLSQSMVRIGPKWVGRGLSRWLRDAAGMENSAVWIREKSEFMRNRMNTQMREINEIRNSVGVNTGRFSGWVDEAMRTVTLDRVNKQAVVDSYFWLIHKGQQIADIPTWIGAYEKALASNEQEERAIALADQAVLDSQGGGQAKDLASIQRGGPMLKLWTNFYSYFNVTYNLMSESGKRTNWKSPASIGRLAVDFLMLYTVPATLGFFLKHALTGKDDEDDETLFKKLIQENLAYLLGSMVLLREMGSAVQGFAGYKGPAGAGFFSAVGNMIKQVGQGEADAAFWRSLNDTAGVIFHYPAGQVKRTAEGFAAMQEGRTRNPMALIVGAPKE